MAATTYPWGSPVFSASNYYSTAMGDAASGAPVAAIAGTVSATNGSASIVGTSTAFTTALQVGQYVQIHADTSGKVYTISAITDDTHLTLSGNYTGTTNASTTLIQYCQLAICALDYFLHAGFQVTGSSIGIGYYVKSGTPTLEYSTDGTTFTSVGSLTVDQRFHVITVSLGSDATYNVWLRWTAATTPDTCVFNGDQFLTVTGSAPALAAVAASSNAPGGSGYAVAQVPSQPGSAEVEGSWISGVWGSSIAPWANLTATDGQIRFRGQLSEIWGLRYGGATSSWDTITIDGQLTGASATPVIKSSERADSKLWWYKMASGLDNTTVHDYTIAYGGSSVHRYAAIAVNGTLSAVGPRNRGLCAIFGDSILAAYTNGAEGLGHYIGERGYNVVNQAVFGARVQTLYQSAIWPIPLQLGAAKVNSAFQTTSYNRCDLVLVNGGYNDAVHDQSISSTPIADWNFTRTNFRAALTAWLQAIRAAFPGAKILYLNIPPAGSAAPSTKANYNTDIATVITNLADPLTVLADISSISGYYTCNTNGTATATISGGGVTGTTGLSGGTGYATSQSNIPVALVGGGGSGATAHAVSNGSGVITSIVIDTPGSGYTSAPNVVIGHTYDTVHPNYSGYLAIWNAISSQVPTFSSSGGGVIGSRIYTGY